MLQAQESPLAKCTLRVEGARWPSGTWPQETAIKQDQCRARFPPAGSQDRGGHVFPVGREYSLGVRGMYLPAATTSGLSVTKVLTC